MSIKLVYMWHKKFQDGFTNLKDRSRPGQPKPVVSNANIAASMSRPDNNWLEIIMGLAHKGCSSMRIMKLTHVSLISTSRCVLN